MSESWGTLTNKAESAARGGNYAEPKACYKQALADAVARKDVHNAYYTACNLGGLLRLLEEYDEAQKLLKQAIQLRHSYPQQLAREPISPITDLERILVKRNRLPELEQLHLADCEKDLKASLRRTIHDGGEIIRERSTSCQPMLFQLR